MTLEDDLHKLIGDIYAAAIDLDRMPDVVRQMCAITNSPSGGFVSHDNETICHEELVGIDPAYSALNAALQHQNLFVQRCHIAPPGTAVLGERLARLEEWKGLELYHDVRVKVGCVHMLGLSIVNEPGFLTEISLFRPEKAEIHGEEEQRIAGILAGHLTRAFRMAREINKERVRAGHLAGILDNLSVGCLLVEPSGRLVFANARGEALLKRNAPLRLVNGRLAAVAAPDRRAWDMLLRRLAGDNGPATGSAVVLGAVGDKPVRLLAVPLSHDHVDAFRVVPPEASGLGLVVVGADQDTATDAQIIAPLFGLTRAEAELAAALASGETLKAYADANRRSLNTVKTHLKAVFAKTGTSRQAELVRLLGATAFLKDRDDPTSRSEPG